MASPAATLMITETTHHDPRRFAADGFELATLGAYRLRYSRGGREMEFDSEFGFGEPGRPLRLVYVPRQLAWLGEHQGEAVGLDLRRSILDDVSSGLAAMRMTCRLVHPEVLTRQDAHTVHSSRGWLVRITGRHEIFYRGHAGEMTIRGSRTPMPDKRRTVTIELASITHWADGTPLTRPQQAMVMQNVAQGLGLIGARRMVFSKRPLAPPRAHDASQPMDDSDIRSSLEPDCPQNNA
jgi:hypothetical protein